MPRCTHLGEWLGRSGCVAAAIALFALLVPAARAAEATIRADVDARKVGIEDTLALTLTLEGDLSQDPAPPPLKNLRLAGGPSVSTRMSFINGVVSQSKTLTYFLQGVRPGPAEIGPARLETPDGEKTTAAIAIEVVSGSVKPRRQQPGASAADPFGDPLGDDLLDQVFGRRQGGGRGPQPKLFVEASPSRARLHVGEPLVLSYLLYTQASVSQLQFAEAPQFPGFWSEDLPQPDAPPSGEPASVDGESYRRFRLQGKLLYPTKAGSLTIPATKLRLGLPRQGFFDMGSQVVERTTKPVTITVEPLPLDAGFSGAVGRFRATTQVDKTEVPLGEAVTLRFRVEGSGNLKWVDKGPELAVAGAKVFPPQVKSDLKTTADGISGTKTWEFVVVPETGGTLEIPSLAFKSFEPQQGRIVEARTATIPIHVTGTAAAGVAPSRPVAAAAQGGDTRLALRNALDLPPRGWPALGGPALAVLLALSTLLHLTLWGGQHLADRVRAAHGRSAPRRNVRQALSDLERAGRDGMPKEAAAAVIEKTLGELFALRDDDESEAARAVRDVLRDAQFLRYAPQLGDYSEKVREVSERAAAVVRKHA